jgi:ribonuclease P protein component
MTYFFAARKAENAVGTAGQLDGTENHSTEMQCGSRVGLTAGRVLGNAVERNRIKRRMREAIRQHQSELTATVDVVLHPRRAVLEAEFSQIERDVLRAFRAVQLAMKKSCDAESSKELL